MSLRASTSVRVSDEPRGSLTGDPRPAAIETRSLRKVYPPARVAIEDLTLSVMPGEVFGFLGPNGAGKTTTVKILLGLVGPTSGSARLMGEPVDRPRARQAVGYLPETFRFHDWMTGEQLLDFHGRLAGMDGDTRRRRIPEVLAQVGLKDRGRDRLHNYSKGMTQRIGLAQAIVHRPSVVLLDEPTSALDPVGRREVRDLIRTLRSEGMAVFLNSHLLSEVELVCDRVAIVDQGRVVREGRLDDLLNATAELQITLDRVDDDVLRELRQFGSVRTVSDRTIVLDVRDPLVAAPVAEAVVRRGYQLFGLVPLHQSLEDLFVNLVEGGDA